MQFDARVSGSLGAGRLTGRLTGSYLRDAAAAATRIIERDPDRSLEEVTAEVLGMLEANGIRHADPAEVRKVVAEARQA